MRRDELLQEQYEDALFAVLMNHIALKEGEKALEENERLKNDESAAVPEDVSRRCHQTIDRAFAKRRRRSFGRTVWSAIRVAAVASVTVFLLCAFAFAASPEFRAGVLNMTIEIFEESTVFRFSAEQSEEADPQSEELWKTMTTPCVPDGFVLLEQEITSSQAWYVYSDMQENKIKISYFSEASGAFTLDTEGMEIEQTTIQEHEALITKKDGHIDLMIAIEERAMFVVITADYEYRDLVIEIAQKMKF